MNIMNITNVEGSRLQRIANPNNKFSAQQMQEELVRHVQLAELDENDIPKTSTIQNWIAGFSQKWKEAWQYGN
ncbi:hypothetical protein C1645_835819 [Glomus cerebriforme]|uniref:Uncharacterized protein n=1 Tax=Glomus cerebriforme TaxID=658196 RepID=A0A397SDR8_9GLOM|nr:hypothetical protein C1645_835819 [Glomus cerebriforme]